MPRKRKCDKRKPASKRTRLEIGRDIANLVIAVTMLFGNPIPWAEQEIVTSIQGPPVTVDSIESLRVPVPDWVQPVGPPI